MNFEDKVDITDCGIKTRSIDNLMNCVIKDHPDIYWLKSIWTYWYDEKDIISKIGLSYNLTKVEVDNLEIVLEDNTERLLKGVDTKSSDADKIKQIHDNIIKSSYYSTGGECASDLRGVMIEGRGVCESYAEATKYLLDKIGIPSILVSGNTSGGGHEWNLVLVDNEWLALDTTWGDPIGDHLAEDYVSYEYFLIPVDQMMTMGSGRRYHSWCKDILPE